MNTAPPYLTIPDRKGREVRYACEPLPPGDSGEVGWALSKLRDGKAVECYHLIRDEHGWRCDCASFVFVKERLGEQCKHLEKAQEEGLL